MGDTCQKINEDELHQLLNCLNAHKTIIASVSSFIRWRVLPRDPAIIFGVVTVAFAWIWLIQPPFLTLLTSSAAILIILDLLLSSIVHKFSDSSIDAEHEGLLFEQFCLGLLRLRNTLACFVASALRYRRDQPVIFYSVTLTFLLCVSYFGYVVDNICLFYFCALALLMLPGIRKHRLMEQFFNRLLAMLSKQGQKKKVN